MENLESRSVTRQVNMTSFRNNITYRVAVYSRSVEVMCFDEESVDSAIEGSYADVDDLPQWMQERLAVLYMTSAKQPTEDIPGVGRRITDTVYWVYGP